MISLVARLIRNGGDNASHLNRRANILARTSSWPTIDLMISRRGRKTTGSSLPENDIENGIASKGEIASRTNIVNEVRKVSDGSEFLGGEQRFNLWRRYLGSEFARSAAFLAGILLPFSLFRDEQS